MLQTLHAAWSGRRVLLLDDCGPMTRFLHTLLLQLGARPACLPLGAGSEALARALTDGRVCCLIVPCLRALTGGLSDQLHALDGILMEAREAGVPLAMLLSDENVYRAAHHPWLVREDDPVGGETRAGLVHALLQLFADGVSRGLLGDPENVYRAAHHPWLVREDDPVGGETRAGLVHALLQLFADGVSRGLLGDPVHVLCVRHMPCLGCGHPDVAAYDRWCQAFAQGEPLCVPQPDAQGVFLHPLDICAGSLLLGARFLLGDIGCTGPFNLAVSGPLCVPQPDAQGVFLHPLDICAGSLLLGARFLLGDIGCTGPFNLAVSGENCMPNRTAALRLCRRIGYTRPLLEAEPSSPHRLVLPDGSCARRLCGAYPRIAADEALSQLWALSCAAKEGGAALEQAISAQAEAYLSAL